MSTESATAGVTAHVIEPATLEFHEVHKHYGGLHAVDGVSATVKAGEIFGIAGSNGAGKTTLFDVISGLTPPTSGEILMGGVSLAVTSVHHRCHLGMARTFQHPTVTGDLSVSENIVVASRFGRAREHWTGFDSGGTHLDWVLGWVGMEELADGQASLLGVFDQKRLMLATAMALGPRVLLLDEPFGGLNPHEIEITLELIRSAASLGVTVVIIEHVMRALVQLAGRVLVMHRGKTLFEGTPEEMMADRQVIEIYLGSKKDQEGRSES